MFCFSVVHGIECKWSQDCKNRKKDNNSNNNCITEIKWGKYLVLSTRLGQLVSIDIYSGCVAVFIHSSLANCRDFILPMSPIHVILYFGHHIVSLAGSQRTCGLLSYLDCGLIFQLSFLWWGNCHSVDCWVDLSRLLLWWPLFAKWG